LPEILLKGVELAQDRRKTRYSRLREAIDAGLGSPEERKPKRKPSEPTEAVDPELDEVARRLMRRNRF